MATFTAYTFPRLSPTYAVSPATVTPVRLTSFSASGASHAGLCVARSIAATCESNDPLAVGVDEGEPVAEGLDVAEVLAPGGESPYPSV